MKVKKGFVLIEALLAVGLISGSMIMRAQFEKGESDNAQYRLVGREVSNIVAAIDKRVLLDGVEGTSPWDAKWSDTDKVLESFSKELIARDNPECGSSDGWLPKLSENNDVALVSCEMNKGIFKGFSLESERSGSNNLLQEWSFTLYAEDEKFDKLFGHYHRVLNSAKLADAVRVTGAHEYRLIDRINGNSVTPQKCLSLRSRCGIQATFKLNKVGIAEDYHLRVNGENSMRNSLTFSSSAKPAVCYRYDGSNKKVETVCGLEYDIANEDLILNAKEVSAGSIHITSENENETLAPVFCKSTNASGDQSKVLCGMTTVESGGSVFAETYVNAVHADEFIRLAKKGSRGIAFSVNNQGDMLLDGNATIKGNSIVHGTQTVSGGQTVEKFQTINGGQTVKGNQTVTGSQTVKGNQTVEGNNTTTGVTYANGSFVAAKTALIKGALTTNSGAYVKGALRVGQDGKFEKNVVVDNNAIINKLLVAKNNAVVEGGLHVRGSSKVSGHNELESTLTVRGESRFLEKVFMNKGAQVGGNVDVSGDVKAKNVNASNILSSDNEIRAGKIVRTPRLESSLTFTDRLFMKQFKSAGGSCNAGEVGVTSSGHMLNCVGGKFVVRTSNATTSVAGVVKLSDSVTSTSSTTAATSKAVKTAYDKAKAAQAKADNAYKEATKPSGLKWVKVASSGHQGVKINKNGFLKKVTFKFGGIKSREHGNYKYRLKFVTRGTYYWGSGGSTMPEWGIWGTNCREVTTWSKGPHLTCDVYGHLVNINPHNVPYITSIEVWRLQ